jgi:TPP-dependent pyruvate/acetoin dehydrogenase alpha subunit
MHMSMGQEAISVGMCHALEKEDQIWTSYRSHAAFLAKTGNLAAFFSELYGKVIGLSAGRAGSMHLVDTERGHMISSAVVAANIPAAVGAAFANKQKRNQHVSCAFLATAH